MTTPTLHDDRVDTMRLAVMHSVDQDIRRRGRRARRTAALAAAAVLVVGLGGRAVTSIDAGAGGDDAGSSSSVAAGDSGSSTADRAAPDLAPAQSPGALTEQAAPRDDRKVVTTGSITVTVKQPRQTATRLSAYVEGLGGRIDSRTENGAGSTASASLQVRVPATKVSATIKQLATYGTVEDVSLQNDDVTATYRDLAARIDALDLSIGRLQKILAEADTTGQVISAESALTKRQEQLEQLQSQKRSLEGQVELSTITIDLAQRPSVDTVEPGGFTGGLRDGWNGLVSTVNAGVELVGVMLPWAVIGGLVLGGWRLAVRRRTRA